MNVTFNAFLTREIEFKKKDGSVAYFYRFVESDSGKGFALFPTKEFVKPKNFKEFEFCTLSCRQNRDNDGKIVQYLDSISFGDK